jgi:LacI family transcriptional regulator
VVVDFVSVDLGPYSIEILRGLVDHAGESGVEVTISTVPAAKLRERNREDWAAQLADGGKSGLVLLVEDVTPDQTAAIRERGIPVVVIDPLGPPPPGVVSIGATNWSGGKAATDHLIALGHTRIAFIGGPEPAEYSQARMHGYLAALMAHGLPAPAEYLEHGPFLTATGHEASGRLLDLRQPPTAIFATSDDTAVGVLRQAHNRGLRVPEDLSVVGFDNTYVSVQSVPNLTTVAQPLEEMGRMALRTVLRLLAGESLDSDHVELATRLMVRDSTTSPSNSILL